MLKLNETITVIDILLMDVYKYYFSTFTPVLKQICLFSVEGIGECGDFKLFNNLKSEKINENRFKIKYNREWKEILKIRL